MVLRFHHSLFGMISRIGICVYQQKKKLIVFNEMGFRIVKFPAGKGTSSIIVTHDIVFDKFIPNALFEPEIFLIGRIINLKCLYLI
jgi:hypothetical protein